jgi:hypothetical protein
MPLKQLRHERALKETAAARPEPATIQLRRHVDLREAHGAQASDER